MNNFISRIKYVRFTDILAVFSFLFSLIPGLIMKKKRPHVWLICEEENEARDNGYWLFRYIKRNYPDVDAVYAINKNSPDYKKVSPLGEVIPYGSLRHWVYYLAAEKNISSQKGGKPNAALCYFLEIYGILKNKRIFLQHGIIKDDLKWLYYDVTKFALFVCAAKPEYEYVKKQFGYPADTIKLLGLCRFDNLIANHSVKRQILIMPTWRQWLSRSIKTNYEQTNNFKDTTYYKKWNSLLTNIYFEEMLKKHNISVVFYPHRNMQKFLDNFKIGNNSIIIADWREYDVQALLKESIFLITDYSSIAFDFAYMRKPLLYYQFDLDEFRKNQYQEGYFSYEYDGFGEVIENEYDLFNVTNEYIENDFSLKKKYANRINNFFIFNDSNNCKRNYEAIKNL